MKSIRPSTNSRVVAGEQAMTGRAVVCPGFRDAATMNAADLFESLVSTSTGLNANEATRRHATFGTNDVNSQAHDSWQLLGRQFKSPFLYLLLAAAALALYSGAWTDAIVIIVFVLINCGLGFLQEKRAAGAAALLRRYWRDSVSVRRDGREVTLWANELVPGDVVSLRAGDRIPADVRFFRVSNVSVDESILTGESVSVPKTDQPLVERPSEAYRADNIGFGGTVLLTGHGEAVVFATGPSTAFGQLVKLTANTQNGSAFDGQISAFGTFILKLVSVTLVFIFALNVALKGFSQIGDLLLFSMALTVGVIPEALPVVMTLVRSGTAMRLAKRHVIVKRLSAIDDLGSIDILCTDKTGTLTQNKLQLSDCLTEDRSRCLTYGLLASGADVRNSLEPFDQAIWKAADVTTRELAEKFLRLDDLPFEPIRRRNAVLIENPTGERELVVRGAPEAIIELCRNVPQPVELGQWLSSQGLAGRRLLAIARKSLPSETTSISVIDETDLQLLGVVAFDDPLKVGTLQAVRRALELGVQVKILTGDAAAVSGAVAVRLGLIDDPTLVITGDEFDKLPPEQQLTAVIKYHVFARVNPEQKFRVIKLLTKLGHQTGFLGEGFNDGPSLKAASVAIAVANASDVSKDAADVILLNRSLGTIIEGIAEGRRNFANVIKYLKITLASNFGNFYAIAVASLLVPFLPMLPVQILLVNLLTDLPMVMLATDTVPTSDLRRPSRSDPRLVVLAATLLGVVSTAFDFTTFAVFRGFGPEQLRTAWFIESVLTEIVLIYSVRSSGWFFRAVPAPRSIRLLSGLVILLAVTLTLLPSTQRLFGFVTLSASHFIVIGCIVIGYLLATETMKRAVMRFINRSSAGDAIRN